MNIINSYSRNVRELRNMSAHRLDFNLYSKGIEWNQAFLRDIMVQLFLPELNYEYNTGTYIDLRGTHVLRISNISEYHDMRWVAEYVRTYKDRRKSVIVAKTSNNKNLSNAVIEEFKKLDTYKEIDFEDALKVSNGHSYTLFWNENLQSLIYFTSSVEDEAIFKLGAAIHTQFKTNIDEETVAKLLTCDHAGYLGCLDRLFSGYLEMFKKNEKYGKMKQYLSDINAAKRQALEIGIRDEQNRVREYERVLSEILTKIQSNQRELMGLTKEKGSEFLEFLLANCKEQITWFDRVNSSKFGFSVVTPLLYWEEDDYKCMRRNVEDDGYPEWMITLLDKIFLEKEVELIFNQAFSMDINANHVSSLPGYYNTEYGMPNPHHESYNCWGENGPIIMKFMSSGDYISAYLQAVSAIAGLNIADGAVWERFLRYIGDDFCTRAKCIKVKATGDIMTIHKYITSLGLDDDLDDDFDEDEDEDEDEEPTFGF